MENGVSHYPEGGFWITTNSGVIVDFNHPERTDVRIEDIAHSLARLCRFNGHTNGLYTVAQHSCAVAEVVAKSKPAMALTALMHDAHEAYTGDMPGPLKRWLRNQTDIWDKLEAAFQSRISDVFWLDFPEPEYVKMIDGALLPTEANWQLPRQEWSRRLFGVERAREPHGTCLDHVWNERYAKERFLSAYRKYSGKSDEGVTADLPQLPRVPLCDLSGANAETELVGAAG